MNALNKLIVEALAKAWVHISKIFVAVIIDIVVNFLKDVIKYFQSLALKKGVHKPFIMDANADEAIIFEKLIPEGKKDGIIEGVFNENTDDIDSIRFIGGEGVDQETKDILKKDPLVVLSSN